MTPRYEQEIRELHRFFEAWFNGSLPDTHAAFARFADVMAQDFEIITPSGSMLARDVLLETLRKAHGRDHGAPMRIWIENPRVRRLGPDLLLTTYEEWQERGSQKKGRLSTAIFQKKENAPNGLIWRHLHEVWLPPKRS